MTSGNFSPHDELVCPRPPRFRYIFLITKDQELYKLPTLQLHGSVLTHQTNQKIKSRAWANRRRNQKANHSKNQKFQW